MEKTSRFLRVIGLIGLCYIVISGIFELADFVSKTLNKAETELEYISFQPLYTSEPSPTDGAIPPVKNWKPKRVFATLMGEMPNHILIAAVLIVFFAASGFILIFVFNSGLQRYSP